MEENIQKIPILVNDLTSMLKRKATANMKPYDSLIIKLNNEKVDLWREKVLDKISDNEGKVLASRGWDSWKLYEEGVGVTRFMEMKEMGVLPNVDDSIFQYWKDFFEKSSLEEMHAAGPANISCGWGIVEHRIKTWYAEQKWEKLFSKSKDPLYWEKNYHKHTDVLLGKVFPYWNREEFEEIAEKVRTILSNPIYVQGTSGFS